MSDTRSLTPAEDEAAYGRIEAAMTESARGRRFLAEYARRNRSADTGVLLDAIGRIENAITQNRGGDVERFRGDLLEMAEAIARTKAEIAAMNAPGQDQSRLSIASEALDAIVRATERATSEILGAAEEVQEAAWTLREGGAAPELCDELDRRATQIYTACSFQDLTAQRTGRVVHTLRYLEERIASMIAIWGKGLDAVPPPEVRRPAVRPADGLQQGEVDRFLETGSEPDAPTPRVPLAAAVTLHDDVAFLPEEEAVAAPAVAAPDTAMPAADADLGLAFADLDSLSIEEKIALFS